MNSRISLACASLLAALCLTAAADQVYRWVDKDGHVHYSQTPPAGTGVQAQSVNMSAPPPDPVTVQNQQNLAQQLKDKDKQAQAAAEKQQQDAQKKDQQKKNCDDLRERLAVLTQSGRTATVDAQGQVNYLSDEDRQKQEKALQDQIATDCSTTK
jgi:hypothetical protein